MGCFIQIKYSNSVLETKQANRSVREKALGSTQLLNSYAKQNNRYYAHLEIDTLINRQPSATLLGSAQIADQIAISSNRSSVNAVASYQFA